MECGKCVAAVTFILNVGGYLCAAGACGCVECSTTVQDDSCDDDNDITIDDSGVSANELVL